MRRSPRFATAATRRSRRETARTSKERASWSSIPGLQSNTLRLLAPQRPIQRLQLRRGPNVLPSSFEQLAGSAPGPNRLLVIGRQRSPRVGSKVAKHARIVQTDVAERVARRAIEGKRAIGIEREVPKRMKRRIRHHHQVHLRLGCKRHSWCACPQTSVIEIAKHVAADRQENRRLALRFQQRQSLGNPARRLQRMHLVRITNLDTPSRTVAKIRLQHPPKPRVINHDDFKIRRRQPFNLPDDQRFAAHFQERLGTRIRQRTHAFAAPGGENHCSIQGTYQNVYPTSTARPSSVSSSRANGRNGRYRSDTFLAYPINLGRSARYCG